jgi:hypothetical protein
MLFYTSINIGPLCNLYSAVDSGSVSSWLFAPPYWRGFFHENLCVYFISLTSDIRGRVRHIVFIHIVAAIAAGFCLRFRWLQIFYLVLCRLNLIFRSLMAKLVFYLADSDEGCSYPVGCSKGVADATC